MARIGTAKSPLRDERGGVFRRDGDTARCIEGQMRSIKTNEAGPDMAKTKTTMAQQVAQAVSEFQKERTGHAPQSVTAVWGEETLVVTLYGALSPAEQAMARSAGAAQLQDYHRQLFTNSDELLRQKIKQITGIEVREAAAEFEPCSGTVVRAFASGTVVQVFLMASLITAAA